MIACNGSETRKEPSAAEKFLAFAQKVIYVPKKGDQRKEEEYRQGRKQQGDKKAWSLWEGSGSFEGRK